MNLRTRKPAFRLKTGITAINDQGRPAGGPDRGLAISLTMLSLFLLLLWPVKSSAFIINGFPLDQEINTDLLSSVPLLIIDFGSIHEFESAGAEGRFSGIDARLLLIDRPALPNRLSDMPTSEIKTIIKPAPASETNHKISFSLSFPPDETENQGPSLLGLTQSESLSLLGSDRDKGMLRNYLGLLLASHLQSGPVPAAKYCELIFKKQNRYYYQGLYLLADGITPDGFFIKPADNRQTEVAAFINFGLEPDKGKESLFLLQPGADMDPLPVAPPDSLFIKTEQSLSSKKSSVFFKAQSSLDLNSFAEAYLLNLVMMNCLPDQMPFYFYHKGDDKISAAPRWEFWPALDNSTRAYAIGENFDALYPWYRHLLESSDFIALMRKRFFALDRGPWEVKKVEHAIDELAVFLGPALDRDWRRWAAVYKSKRLENGIYENPRTLEAESIIRQTSSPTEEIIKLKYSFRKNNQAVKKIMEDLRWKKVFFNEEKKTRKNLMLTAGFVLLFFAMVAYVRRRM